MFDVPIHKLIVHFPIALMIIATIYDAWAVYTRRPELHRLGYGLTLWAAVGALAAVGTGLQLAEMVHVDKGAVTGHAGFGITSAIVIAALAGIRYSAQAQEQKDYRIGWLVVEVIAAALIFATAITGHRL
ncbi:MAG TPA: DUF2231 domain-containing protein [Terriglobia bacterium]|jgi:uncharacterized membrane protein